MQMSGLAAQPRNDLVGIFPADERHYASQAFRCGDNESAMTSPVSCAGDLLAAQSLAADVFKKRLQHPGRRGIGKHGSVRQCADKKTVFQPCNHDAMIGSMSEVEL